MFLVNFEPRPDAIKQAHALGFQQAAGYWREDRAYGFSLDEVEHIERETVRLHGMVKEAVLHMARRPDVLGRLQIPETHWAWLRASLEQEGLYGRFDFRFDGEDLKLYEYNADTPTALWEAAVFQWLWMQDIFPKGDVDQFNSIEEKLTAAFAELAPAGSKFHLTCLLDNAEDAATTAYLCDRAKVAGLDPVLLDIADLGTTADGHDLVDAGLTVVRRIFKLYPWEWMLKEPFSKHLPTLDTIWFEPPWKVLASSKALLPVLWEMFPGDPALLAASFVEHKDSDRISYVRKPLFSREGANIKIGDVETPGGYGAEGYVWQEKALLPEFDGRYPVIGSWVVNGQAAGMGIRESDTVVTTNTSSFVPHFIRG